MEFHGWPPNYAGLIWSNGNDRIATIVRLSNAYLAGGFVGFHGYVLDDLVGILELFDLLWVFFLF